MGKKKERLSPGEERDFWTPGQDITGKATRLPTMGILEVSKF
jgi:hypothetical protein